MYKQKSLTTLALSGGILLSMLAASPFAQSHSLQTLENLSSDAIRILDQSGAGTAIAPEQLDFTLALSKRSPLALRAELLQQSPLAGLLKAPLSGLLNNRMGISALSDLLTESSIQCKGLLLERLLPLESL